MTGKDRGYQDCGEGWYDVQNQGVCNDYCRWVDGQECRGIPESWWSCAFAGFNSHNTHKGEFHENTTNMRTCVDSGILQIGQYHKP